MLKVILKYVFLIPLITLLTNLFPITTVYAGNPPDGTQSSLVETSPGSNQAPADGSTQTSMTLTLKDSGGVALVGDTASLSTTDPNAVISPTSATLDANGQAIFTITSTTVGTDNLDATDQTTVTTLSALGEVTFTAVPTSTPQNSNSSNIATPGCQNVLPTNPPNLFQIDPTNTTATLYFAQPAASQFDGYTISYGLNQNADSYNVSFSQGLSSGAIKYTIQNLSPKINYYFKIRANNGCAPGPWSNVKSAQPVRPQIPVTGPSSMFVTIATVGFLTFLGGFSLFLFL